LNGKSTRSCDLLRVGSNDFVKNPKSFEPTLNKSHDYVDFDSSRHFSSFLSFILPPLYSSYLDHHHNGHDDDDNHHTPTQLTSAPGRHVTTKNGQHTTVMTLTNTKLSIHQYDLDHHFQRRCRTNGGSRRVVSSSKRCVFFFSIFFFLVFSVY
jgi:hypothetical protein